MTAATPGTPEHAEYLWAIDHCRGSLDCFTAYLDHPATPAEHWAGHLNRFRITRKTAKRIYYVQMENPVHPRIAYVDREKIEADGDVTRGRWGHPDHHLYLAEPPMPEWWAPRGPDLAALKQAMADAHPDRGGTGEGFRRARARYVEAKTRAET